MTWTLILSVVTKLIQWYLSSKDRERAALLVEKFRNIEKASDDEIKRALEKHRDARGDPNVGRM